MNDLKDKVVLITGASSGIGEATARRLSRAGAKLMLAARREENLKQISEAIEADGGEAAYKVTDVTDRGQVQALADATLEIYGRIDVLFNNAGLMPNSPLAARKVDDWDQMIDVNVKGLLYAIDAVLTHMNERGSGHVINLSSVAGHVVFPGSAVYSGTKFAVWAISEGLRKEAGDKIRVTTLSPGAVATELPKTITHDETAQAVNDLYKDAIDPDAIARATQYALEQPPEVDVNEIIIRPTAQAL